MITKNIESLLASNQEFTEFYVTENGNSCNIVVISDCFIGLKKVAQQQLVYSCISSVITSGEVHAVTIKTFTSDQWSQYKLLNLG